MEGSSAMSRTDDLTISAFMFDLVRLERELATVTEQRDRLAEAAQAVVDRWETPFWKEVGQYHYIDSLRNALAAVKGGSDE
jgi:hypothetical protein